MRSKKLTVKFSEELKDGHTFIITLNDIQKLTQEDIFMIILKEFKEAGVRLKVEELEE